MWFRLTAKEAHGLIISLSSLCLGKPTSSVLSYLTEVSWCRNEQVVLTGVWTRNLRLRDLSLRDLSLRDQSDNIPHMCMLADKVVSQFNEGPAVYLTRTCTDLSDQIYDIKMLWPEDKFTSSHMHICKEYCPYHVCTKHDERPSINRKINK